MGESHHCNRRAHGPMHEITGIADRTKAFGRTKPAHRTNLAHLTARRPGERDGHTALLDETAPLTSAPGTGIMVMLGHCTDYA
jgi:hypothetical protein